MGDELIALNTLEKATPHITRGIYLVRMDIDDFYAVIQLLKDCEGLEIVVEGFLLDDPEKIEKLDKSRISDLVIQTSRPYLSIELRTYGTRIYVGDASILSRGLVSSVLEIVDRYSFVRPLAHVWFALVIITICVNGFTTLGFLLARRPLLPLPVAITSLSVSVGWLWFWSVNRKKFILYLRRKHDSFTKRHKDLIEKIVLLLAGAILGLLGQLVVKNLTTP